MGMLINAHLEVEDKVGGKLCNLKSFHMRFFVRLVLLKEWGPEDNGWLHKQCRHGYTFSAVPLNLDSRSKRGTCGMMFFSSSSCG